MNEKALKTLEFDKIIEKLSSYAASEMGKKCCTELLPSSDYSEILSAQEETRDALARIYKHGALSFQGLSDIRPHLRLLEIDSSLTAKELLELARLLAVTAQVKEYGESDSEEGEEAFDSLHTYFDMLEPLEFLHQRITSCILSADEISDDASSALRDIRKEIKQTNIAIHNKLSSIVNSQSSKTLLQDALITMRNGRYCVPVKAEYKSSFPGMIHDQSATGSTLFIEPMAVVQLNNKLKELDMKEQAEIEKILQLLSAQAASCTKDIEEDQKILTKLDFIFAKAKYAKDYQGSEPIFNTDGIIDIKQARHPLLHPKKVVPIHIYLGETFHMLLLTGPNTGGKTVSLKTVGLFQLMGQAGLHIPAFEGSRLAVFSDVFADIGDEQSIEMNLSTFSSHMTNIVEILEKATPDSLVLLDELCSGTDPTEGAALAISILDDLHTAKVRTVATTHYAELKMFAMDTEGVENGCCEFDLDTLSPTYRLLIGIPGKSNAFAISKRLGLPDYIIEQARSQIDVSAIDYENMLAELERKKAEIEKEQAELQRTREEVESLRNQLKQKQDNAKDKREAILREAREEAHNILANAKDVADESIRKYNAWAKHPGQDNTKKMEAQRSNLRNKMSKLEKQLAYKSKKASQSHSPEDFKPGDPVFVTTLSLNGTVQSAANKNGDVTVQMGFLTTTVNYKDLELLDEKKEKASTGNHPQDQPTDRYSINKSATISPEINLLGCTVDEGISRLEKYLDDAMIAGLSSVRVVHGKGTGALRKGIHEYLRRQKFVKSYQLAEFGEGDAGVTVVTFK
ncbi:MAG: endonuclease MutS2 [Clostridiales bacterium]|nr:endonuclease MutS2 [Clostridiales bacterium]